MWGVIGRFGRWVVWGPEVRLRLEWEILDYIGITLWSPWDKEDISDELFSSGIIF